MAEAATVLTDQPLIWQVSRGRTLALDRPRIMGILNITPDSFADGGRYTDPAAAVEHARRMIDEGADVVDVGGESTRPGSERVSAAEQIARVLPVIDGLRSYSDVIISIDTTLSEVAGRAIEAGADIINDVSACREDGAMAPLAAEAGTGLILMHRLRPPDSDSYSNQYDTAPEYGDVVEAVRGFLAERVAFVTGQGVQHQSIVVDPGLGFGKTVEQNYELLRQMPEMMGLNGGRYPVLSAASRKSFIGAVAGASQPLPSEDRLAGSLAITTMHVLAGIRLFRVHDVGEHRQAADVVWAAVRTSS